MAELFCIILSFGVSVALGIFNDTYLAILCWFFGFAGASAAFIINWENMRDLGS